MFCRKMSKINIYKKNKKRNGNISRYNTIYSNKIHRIISHSFLIGDVYSLKLVTSEIMNAKRN
jgi:hypothetical protein